MPGRLQSLRLPDLKPHGAGLHRPECARATANGNLITSDWRGGVCVISPSGKSVLIRARDLEFEIRPNGIGLMPDGRFLLTHLGDDRGGLFRLHRDGRCETVLNEVSGQPPHWHYPL